MRFYSALISEPGKSRGTWKTWFFDPTWQLRGFWQDRNDRKHILHLYRPRVPYFLSHKIVKSLTLRIYGKFKFQCTRIDPQNHPHCPGSIQDTFIICSSISHHQIFLKYVAKKRNLENPVHWQKTKLKKTGFAWKTWFFGPIWQLRGFWQAGSVRTNGAQLSGTRCRIFCLTE